MDSLGDLDSGAVRRFGRCIPNGEARCGDWAVSTPVVRFDLAFLMLINDEYVVDIPDEQVAQSIIASFNVGIASPVCVLKLT